MLLNSGIAGAASSTRRSARAQRASAARGSLACAALARRIRASARRVAEPRPVHVRRAARHEAAAREEVEERRRRRIVGRPPDRGGLCPNGRIGDLAEVVLQRHDAHARPVAERAQRARQRRTQVGVARGDPEDHARAAGAGLRDEAARRREVRGGAVRPVAGVGRRQEVTRGPGDVLAARSRHDGVPIDRERHGPPRVGSVERGHARVEVQRRRQRRHGVADRAGITPPQLGELGKPGRHERHVGAAGLRRPRCPCSRPTPSRASITSG